MLLEIEFTEKRQVDLKTLLVDAGVRYWEDSTVDGEDDNDDEPRIPCAVDGRWKPIIDLETGVIQNWKQGVTADVHYKVCDDGTYVLMSDDGLVTLKREGYVPDCMNTKEVGDGDYIVMEIDENGKIANWSFDESDIASFQEEND